MLSDMVARRVAFAESPAIPAFKEEDMVIHAPFCCIPDVFVGHARADRLNTALTDKILLIRRLPAKQNDLDPIVASGHRVGVRQAAVRMSGHPPEAPRINPTGIKKLMNTRGACR